MNSSKVGALPLCVKGMFSILNVLIHFKAIMFSCPYLFNFQFLCIRLKHI